MKYKTKTLLAGMLMLAVLCCGTRSLAQTLVLHHPGGTTTDVELLTQPRIEFLGDRVLITSTVLNMEYAKTDVLRFTYKGNPQGVSSPRGDADCTRENGRLVFHNVNATDDVAVYKANGIRVAVRLERTGTDAALPLNAIPKGVYLLSVNGRTSKFTRP